MAELAGGIIGIAGVAVQLTQVIVTIGLDWKDAPKEIKAFRTELESLESISRDIWKYIIDNPGFRESVGNDNSAILQALHDGGGQSSSTKQIIDYCKSELQWLLDEITKRATGGCKGWGRFKSAFLLKRTGDAVQALSRRYEHLNRLIQIDSANLSGKMYREIKEISQNQQAQYKEDMDHKVLDWLSTSRFGLQVRDLLDRREQGTGEWLIQTPTFQTWEGSDKPQILLCRGMPGAGKTMLAASVIEHIESKNEGQFDVGIAYFFCNFQRQEEQSLSHILLSLLRQLAQRQGIISNSVQRLYEKYGNKQMRPLRKEIADALQQIISDFRKVYIIIDALDEYQPPNGNTDDLLWEIAKLHREAGANIFLTSRVIAMVSDALEDSLTMEIRAHNDDILAYTESRIQSSRLARVPKLHGKIREGVLKAAGGMFLLVELHMRTLQSQFTIGDIEDTLESLPQGQQGLGDTYDQAMKRIENKRDTETLAKRVFSWLTFTRRPLKCPEFLHAISTKPGVSSLDHRYIPDIQDLLSICAGLVTLDERSNIVRLVHYTVQEYFDRTWTCWFPEGPKQIERVCLTYLSLDMFTMGRCSTDEELEARLRKYPFYTYACRNWAHHLLFPLSSDIWTLLEGLTGDGNKVSACAQALLAVPASTGYSQRVPVQAGAVHVATYFGSEQLVRALLNRGYSANHKDSFGQTPLMWGAIYGHAGTALLLLEEDTGAEVNAVDNSRQTALHHAIRHTCVPVVRALLRHKADITVQDENGYTPIYVAADMGSYDILELLLYGLDRDTEKKNHLSPEQKNILEDLITKGVTATLRKAIELDDEPQVRFLLEKGVNLSYRIDSHHTCLTIAAKKGSTHVLQTLLEWGADPQIGTSLGGTALHAAIEAYAGVIPDANTFSTILRLLLESGVNINEVCPKGHTAFYRAADRGNQVALRCLARIPELDHNLADHEGQTPLLIAATQGNKCIVQFLLEKYGFDRDTRDNQARTALICTTDRWVWDNGHPDYAKIDGQRDREAIVRLLLEGFGADINSQDLKGRTALICASAWDESESEFSFSSGSNRSLVETLLQHHARVDIKDNSGRTALAYAAEAGNEPTARLLFTYGAQVEVQRLEKAATLSHANVVKPLLESADEHIKSEKWLATAQIYDAVKSGNLDKVKALVTLGANINAPTITHSILRVLNDSCLDILPFLLAQGINARETRYFLPTYWENGSQKLVKALFDITGPINFESPKEAKTFLHNSVLRDELDFVQLVFDNGYDIKFVEHCSGIGDLPLLHLAVINFCEKLRNGNMANLLLDQGANTEVRSKKGKTALHRAIRNPSLTKLLVSRGANLEARSNNGETPLAMAAKWGSEETVKLLLELGADPFNVNLASLTPKDTNIWRLSNRAGFVRAVRMIQSARYISSESKEALT